jgi:hypothetical protein
MDTLSHFYQDISFNNLMKAKFRKYLDNQYKDSSIVEIDRKIVDENILEIYRIHTNKYFFKTFHLIEKIKINRQLKTYESNIDHYLYTENCKYEEKNQGVQYIQQYNAPAFVSSKKKEVFEIGIAVVDKIINNLQLRNTVQI